MPGRRYQTYDLEFDDVSGTIDLVTDRSDYEEFQR
jgi:hypothetical protein